MYLPSEASPENCPSCDAKFKGKFCHKCGEKKVSAKDFRLDKYARLVAQHFTHFDSKLLLSIRTLIRQPGKLTSDYVEGRRIPYVKPLQLFLIVNLMFFLFFGDNDVFAPKLKYIYQVESTRLWTGERVRDLADAYAQREGIGIEAAIRMIDTQTGNMAKAMLYILNPVWALLFFALFYRRNPYFLCHLIFATHWFSLLLILIMAGGAVLFLVLHINGMTLLWSFLAMLLPFHLLATRHFYGDKWWWLALKTPVFFAGFIFTYLLYRDFVLFLTMKLL